MRRWNDELAGREPHVVGVHDRVPRRKYLPRHGARSGSEVPGPSGREGGGLPPGESAGGAAPVRRLRKPVGSVPGGGGAEKIAQGRETGLGKEYYLRALNGSPPPPAARGGAEGGRRSARTRRRRSCRRDRRSRWRRWRTRRTISRRPTSSATRSWREGPGKGSPGCRAPGATGACGGGG